MSFRHRHRQTAKRQCATCGARKNLDGFRGDAAECMRCQGGHSMGVRTYERTSYADLCLLHRPTPEETEAVERAASLVAGALGRYKVRPDGYHQRLRHVGPSGEAVLDRVASDFRRWVQLSSLAIARARESQAEETEPAA